MKTILTLIILSPLISFAQIKIGASLSAGLSNKSAVGEMAIATNYHNLYFYPISFKIHSKMSRPDMPVIIESRAGYKLAFVEPYIGYGYHMAGQDNKPQYKQYTGLKPACGIILHRGRIILTGSKSGEVYSVMVGIFGVN